jgi:hypothetical protein
MNKIIAGVASAAFIVAAGAAAGCSGSTTTVREIQEAATPAAHTATPAARTATPAPAGTKTVTEQAASGPAAPGAPAAGLAYCGSPADQGGISVNSHTSCPFAQNVRSAWESSGGASTVSAYSPVTGLTYTLSCTATGTGYEVCSSGGNYVEFAAGPVSAPAATGEFDDFSTLSQSVADEQQAALGAAPADDYDSTDDAAVNVTLTPLGDNTYSATAADSDADTGSGDTITVSPDGGSWADTGMNWSGPDVNGGATGYWTTPAVSDYS